MHTIDELTKETQKGFLAVKERLDEIEEDRVTANQYQELREGINILNKQQKAFLGVVADRNYTLAAAPGRFWPSEEHSKQFGEIVLATARGQKAMSGVENISGGFLIPDELKGYIIQKMGIYGKFRKNATVVRMGGRRTPIPRIDSDLIVYCPGEGVPITPSDIKIGMITLDARTWAALTAVSNELDEDSIIGIGEIIGLSVARSLAKQEDVVGFLGDGGATYFGMRGITGALLGVDDDIGNIKGLKVASGNTYAEIALDNFDGVVALLPEEAEEGARWYMSKKFYYTVVWPLARTAGVANIFEILSDRKSRYLLGFEIEFVSCMPSTEADSQICAILGDLQLGAYLGERRDLRIDRSSDVYFANNQVAIRATERIDINAFGVGDTTNAGPIVGLITAAT